MSFEIAVPIFGRHGIQSGAQQDGVRFGTLPAQTVPAMMISKVAIAAASNVIIGDASAVGVITYTDETTDSSSNAQNDVGWPSGVLPNDDELWVVVPAGKSLAGVQLWLTTPGNFTHSNLAWSVDYRAPSGNVAVAIDATSDSPTRLTTAPAGTLISLLFNNPLSTDIIPSLPLPGRTDWGRAVRIRLSGTITAGSQWPLFGRIWPIFTSQSELTGFIDFTTLLQPVLNPDYSTWPSQFSARAGDLTCLVWPEWPAVWEFLVSTSEAGTATLEWVYCDTGGAFGVIPADLVHDPANFRRAVAGTYQDRLGKPADALKMHVLSYTSGGDSAAVLGLTAPALPAGATEVRRAFGYILGWRWTTTEPTLLSVPRYAIEAKQLDPASMTSTLTINAADALTFASVEPESIPGAVGRSTYQLVNRRTAQAVTLAGELTQAAPALSGTVALARQAGDGFLLVQIRGGKTEAGEVDGGSLVISG